MKYKIFLVLIGLGCSMACAQNSPQHSHSELSEQDKRDVAQINTLQKQIDGLERQITSRQRKISMLSQKLPSISRAGKHYLSPGPAIVLNITGGTQIVNSGLNGDGLHKDDKLLIVRREFNNWHIDGIARVDHAYKNDSECSSVTNLGMRPEDEVYVLDRRSSPHSVSNLGL